jgi:hypothetical protein
MNKVTMITPAEPEFTTQMGVQLMVKPRPEGNHACKRCKGTGTKVYRSKKDSMIKLGECLNCHGVGHLTTAQVKEVRANAKAGTNTTVAGDMIAENVLDVETRRRWRKATPTRATKIINKEQ